MLLNVYTPTEMFVLLSKLSICCEKKCYLRPSFIFVFIFCVHMCLLQYHFFFKFRLNHTEMNLKKKRKRETKKIERKGGRGEGGMKGERREGRQEGHGGVEIVD